jgi:hypothetical protein
MADRPTDPSQKPDQGNVLDGPQSSGERRTFNVFGGRRETDRIIQRLVELGIALSAERNTDRLLEMILVEAKQFYAADGGTLYLTTDDETSLAFKIVRNDSLQILWVARLARQYPFHLFHY